jgi:hypothetical protein
LAPKLVAAIRDHDQDRAPDTERHSPAVDGIRLIPARGHWTARNY